MTAFRLIPLGVHAALRSLTGLALMVVPLLAGLGAAAVVLGVVIGAIVVGVSLKAVDIEDRPTIAPGDLHAFDYATVAAVLATALALALLDGDAAAGATFAAASVVMLGGNLLTRYSARG